MIDDVPNKTTGEAWIEDVVSGISIFEGVPVHLENFHVEGPGAELIGQGEPGEKDEPQRPEPEIPAPTPDDVPSPHPSQPEIVPPHEAPAMDPMTPSAPTA